jgi:hypothetical protein
MTAESASRPVRWRRGRGSTEWPEGDQAYAALLDTLTQDLLDTEATRLEMEATSRRGMADVLEEEQELRRNQLAEARRELDGFRDALRDARARGGPTGTAEVPYDTAIAEQDDMADLLIQYLVRPGYAEVRTEEPDPGHHVYHIRVDWDRLLPLATEQGSHFAL